MLPTKLLPERQGWGQPVFHAEIWVWEQLVEVATQEFWGCSAEGKAEKDMGLWAALYTAGLSTDPGGASSSTVSTLLNQFHVYWTSCRCEIFELWPSKEAVAIKTHRSLAVSSLVSKTSGEFFNPFWFPQWVRRNSSRKSCHVLRILFYSSAAGFNFSSDLCELISSIYFNMSDVPE